MRGRALKVALAATASLALAVGCAERRVQQRTVPVPKIEPEPVVAVQEPTLLERYQELNRHLEAEKRRADALAAELDDQRQTRQKAESEVAKLREQLAALEQRAKECDELKAKLDESLKHNLELEATARDLRRELLEERLLSAKREQTILSMKIEKALERRKQTLERPEARAEEPARETAMERGETVAKP